MRFWTEILFDGTVKATTVIINIEFMLVSAKYNCWIDSFDFSLEYLPFSRTN